MNKIENDPICGIYLITNKINNKKYVGQSTDIMYRWHQHCININRSNKRSLIKSAMKHYGIDNFTFEILEVCPPEELNEKEKFYISKYNTYYLAEKSNGYNMTLGGEGQNGNGKKVKQYDLDGNFIKEYNSIIEASRQCHVSDTGISNCCAKRRKQCGGFLWCYDGQEILSPYKSKGKKVIQYDLDGNYIQSFNTMKEASLSLNCSLQLISMCCRKEVKSAANYQWRYDGDDPPGVYCYRS